MKWFSGIDTLTDLRNRYKQLLLKYHPDNNAGIDTTKDMQEINAEYDALLKHFMSNQTYSNNTYSTETELKNILNEVVKIKADILIELIGTWIWISGDTYSIRRQLSELGFDWAPKKKMWYWGKVSHRCTIPMEMSSIREKYGSIVYRTNQEQEQKALNAK